MERKEYGDAVDRMHAEWTRDDLTFIGRTDIYGNLKHCVFEANDKYGQGLVNLWTQYAEDIYQLVALGFLDASEWEPFFERNLFGRGYGLGTEVGAFARDEEQRESCRAGLREAIRRLGWARSADARLRTPIRAGPIGG